MKKLFKNAMLIAASALLAVNFSSCKKDPQDNTEEVNKATEEAIVKQYLNHSIQILCFRQVILDNQGGCLQG